ncbi:GNAT family N-acetyltransferase [Granulicella sp. S156]|uniref:GNAT family N-acetyltransferase n=1 Tax=Granulicella sp. S156 TaxID=1747224 RepID=UPI00131DB900|nr:GNAT family N-acetyltransferase [Granulicella sp. S156]
MIDENISRVSVAPASEADAEELIRANLCSQSLHLPWVKSFTDHQGFDAWMQRLASPTHLGFVVREQNDNSIVGIVNLNEIVRGAFHNAYLGYYAMAGKTGRGLMTEALFAVLSIVFTEIKLHRVEANVQPENHPSIALVQRIGFRLEGFSPRYLFIDGAWRDHQRWAITAEEFSSQISRDNMIR